MYRRALRLLACAASVAAFTFLAKSVIAVNATTIGFAYILLVLVIASTWGFVEAAVTSLLSTLCFNLFFLPPVGTLTIADPQNWIALFSLLATSLIASRLSVRAKRRAQDALERQEDLERLYTFSRSILLTGSDEAFAKQLIRNLAETFGLSAAVLYDRRSGEFHRAGPAGFEGVDDQLRDAALQGTSFSDAAANRAITAVRLGSEPIASLALQGVRMSDAVLQGIANLVAIGLERAKAQDLAHQIEVARQSEQLRTTLIDAMAHEFKTPLTVIKGVTTSLLAADHDIPNSAREQLQMADEEADHLRELMDNAIEMARLDTTHIDIHAEASDIRGIVDEVVRSMHTAIDTRVVHIVIEPALPEASLDRRLIKLALKQLLDNALKYSRPDSPLRIRAGQRDDAIFIEITDYGCGIPEGDKTRIFDRFYRGQSVVHRVPGSGLGLNIALGITRAHGGDLTFTSRPGETTFQMTLPLRYAGVAVI